MRGTPHAHICVFLHEDDKVKTDPDKIDQMMWAEIPIDADSIEPDEFLKEYRKEDADRPRRWKENIPDLVDVSDSEDDSTDSVTFHLKRNLLFHCHIKFDFSKIPLFRKNRS